MKTQSSVLQVLGERSVAQRGLYDVVFHVQLALMRPHSDVYVSCSYIHRTTQEMTHTALSCHKLEADWLRSYEPLHQHSTHCTTQYSLYHTVFSVPISTHCTKQYSLYHRVFIVPHSTHCTKQYSLYQAVHSVPHSTHCTVWYSKYCTVLYCTVIKDCTCVNCCVPKS